MRDSAVKRWSRAHTALFRATRGHLGRRLVDNDMMLLTTTGRTSGRPHTVPLLYLTEGERVVVIASYGGRDHHPDWYVNLRAQPRVHVELPRGRRTDSIASTASAEERAVWWPRVVEAYGGYATYQSRTEREIPVVLLDPLR